MTKEQKLHYLKGGKFKAAYNPKVLDITEDSKNYIGKTIIVYQNCLNTPLENSQYRFNSTSIYGWFPEEDINALEILNEFIENPGRTIQYCYRITYLTQEKLFPSFGKGDWKAPMVVYREYSEDSSNYVINKLLIPKADKVEMRVLNLLEDEMPEWKIIFEDL